MATRPKNRIGEDLERLIKAIGDCKSKTEEDRILFRAIESTKASVKTGKVDKQRTRDFLIKLLYFEMLGHDASFGHFLAVQACGSNSIMTKLVGYLAVAQFLDASDSLILLLVNTWRSDLQNENHVIALSAVCKLVNGDAIGALAHQVVSLTSHSNDIVRKKAVMAMHRFSQIDPRCEAGLAGISLNEVLRKTLCDKDPAVMAATLCALYELAKHDPYPYRNLIPSLSAVIKQIIEHRLSKTYEYHHCPAPFIQVPCPAELWTPSLIQIRLLRILGLLGEGDKPSTDNMRHILLSMMKTATPRNTIGFAVLFECIRTITTVSPDTVLLETAAKSIYAFLRGDNSHNLKYMGLDALGGIVSINFRQAQEHQAAVMDCLEDPDDTLKLKTLELLYKMTKSSNVEIVVEKLIQYMRTCSDEHILNDICNRVSDLAERYAPDTLWYVETMIEMIEAAGNTIPSTAGHNLMKLVAEQEEDLHKAVVEICIKLIEKPKLPQTLLQVRLLDRNFLKYVVHVQEKMCDLIQISNPDEALQGYILTAILKLSAAHNGTLAVDAEDLLRKSLSSKSTDLQQRALELRSFDDIPHGIASIVLPFDASCEDLETQMTQIQSLSFLDAYVDEALQNGAAPYVPEEERDDYGMSLAPEPEVPSSGLRFDAYQSPELPQPTIEAQPIAFDVTQAMPEMNVTSFGLDATPKLPVGARRWGPAEPVVQEPPVIRVENMKVEYTAPESKQEMSIPDYNGTMEVTDRDVLKASLFGERTSNSTTRNRRFLDRRQKSPETRPKTTTTSPITKTPDPMPAIDLLDLSDPQESTTQAQTSGPIHSTPLPDNFLDPFAGMDLLSGPDGLTVDVGQNATPVASAVAPQIDLEALYSQPPAQVVPSPMPSAVPAFAPMHPPMMSMAQNHHPVMSPNIGFTAVGPSASKPTVKDDPFKDLLG